MTTASVLEYPQNNFFLVANSDTLELGGYELPTSGDLKLAHLRIYSRQTTYSYTMKVEVSTSVGGPALATSETETFSNATTGQATGHWLGDLTFEWETPYTLLAGETYYFRLIITGYTRPARPNENTAYLAVWCDWLEPIGLTDTAGAKIALGVYR